MNKVLDEMVQNSATDAEKDPCALGFTMKDDEVLFHDAAPEAAAAVDLGPICLLKRAKVMLI